MSDDDLARLEARVERIEYMLRGNGDIGLAERTRTNTRHIETIRTDLTVQDGKRGILREQLTERLDQLTNRVERIEDTQAEEVVRMTAESAQRKRWIAWIRFGAITTSAILTLIGALGAARLAEFTSTLREILQALDGLTP